MPRALNMDVYEYKKIADKVKLYAEKINEQAQELVHNGFLINNSWQAGDLSETYHRQFLKVGAEIANISKEYERISYEMKQYAGEIEEADKKSAALIKAIDNNHGGGGGRSF